MSLGVKTTCFKAPGVSLGGSGVSIGGVRSPRAYELIQRIKQNKHFDVFFTADSLTSWKEKESNPRFSTVGSFFRRARPKYSIPDAPAVWIMIYPNHNGAKWRKMNKRKLMEIACLKEAGRPLKGLAIFEDLLQKHPLAKKTG